MKEKVILQRKVEQGDFNSGGEISSKLKELLRKLGVDSKIIRKIAIVSYELEMNIIIHSRGGEIEVVINQEEINLYARDQGPGIEDVDKAFQPGFSTATDAVRELGFGAGMGLTNIQRYSDGLDVDTGLGQNTTIKATVKL